MAVDTKLKVWFHFKKLKLKLLLRRVAIFLSLAIAILALIIIPQSLSQTVSPPSEIRGVWLTNVDSDVLFSSSNLNQAIQGLNFLRFNTLYPTIWQGGYTLYPSLVAKRVFGVELDPTPGLQNRDVLTEVINLGHQQGLTVIPWFEFGFMAPAHSKLAQLHPDWITNRQDGSLIKKEGVEERVWLNPFHPEVQQFILDLITEIVKNYDIDGIQFDDHFGLPAEFGYDQYTVNLYQQENKGQPPSKDFYETYWVRWRADKINQFMEKVFKTVKDIKPNCIISLSPNPLHFSLPAYLQDWFTWERKGWIEEIVLQVYRQDLNRFITELERTEVQLAKAHIPVAIGILSGLKNRSTPLNILEQQVNQVRKRNFAGVSFFFYESLWKWAEEPEAARQLAFQGFFPTHVPRHKAK